MPKPAFIVEGQMEQKIIARLCPGHPVRRIGCNGDKVPIERVCDFIASQIRLLGNRNHPIIVIFDREKRDESVAELSARALNALLNHGLGDCDIRLFIADREFEDWYLKDIPGVCANFNLKPKNGEFSGKSGLARLIESATQYHETTIGVDLFFSINLKTVANKCGTFQALMETAIEVECQSIKDRWDTLL